MDEMRTLKLGDQRLTQRAKDMIARFSDQPAKSMPEACVSWAATKGAYRFLANATVEEAKIREAHYQATCRRVVGHKRVLAIQDTTSLDYTGKVAAEEMGYLSNQNSRGLRVHSVLVASVAGVPLGLVEQHTWTRDPQMKGKSKDRRSKATAQKESQRWLDAIQTVEQRLPEEVEVVHVADIEGDIFDLLALARRPGSDILIRVDHNRRVEHPAKYVWEAIHQAPIAGEMTAQITSQADREPREARLTVRFLPLTVRPPHERTGNGVLLHFVLAEEVATPPGADPIVWLLATSLPVDTLQDALLCIAYYTLRWLIERFHFVLKSGCRIEQLYLQTMDRLLRALAIYSIVAWRILWITYETRRHPHQPCTVILQTHEWQALYCTLHKTPTPPQTPPTLLEATIMIARLGGFLARKHDNFPGAKTIWRGLRRLDDIADTWLLLHSHPLGVTYG